MCASLCSGLKQTWRQRHRQLCAEVLTLCIDLLWATTFYQMTKQELERRADQGSTGLFGWELCSHLCSSWPPSRVWTSLIVSDLEVTSPGQWWPVISCVCTAFRPWHSLSERPDSRTNCFITAFCLKGQKVSLARKWLINRKGWGRKNSICAQPVSESITCSVQIKSKKERQTKWEQTRFSLLRLLQPNIRSSPSCSCLNRLWKPFTLTTKLRWQH